MMRSKVYKNKECEKEDHIMKNNKIITVYFAAITSSSLIGLSFLFSKIGLQYSSPLDLLAYRFTFAFIAMLLAVEFDLVTININKDVIKEVMPLSIFYPLLSFGFQVFGLQFIQSSEAGIIFAVGPVFTLILASYFLKEKTTALQKLSILLSVFGVIYITFKKGSYFELQSIKGLLFIMISVLSFSMYNVIGRKLRQKISSADIIFVIIGIGFVVFNILAIGKHSIDGNLVNFFIPLKSLNFIIAVLYLGIFSTFGTSYLTIFILSHLESYKMSVFGNFSTVVSIVAGALFLNEKIFFYHIFGSFLIISGVIGANLLGSRTKN